MNASSREELETCLVETLKISAQEARDYVDQRLCVRYPSSCEGGKATRNLGLTLGDRANLFLLSFEGRTPSKMPDSIVEARLEVCAKCPVNHGKTTPGCCGTPTKLEALVKDVASENDIKGAFRAGWCGVLGANLVIAANLSDRFVTEADAAYDSLPPSCPYRG